MHRADSAAVVPVEVPVDIFDFCKLSFNFLGREKRAIDNPSIVKTCISIHTKCHEWECNDKCKQYCNLRGIG